LLPSGDSEKGWCVGLGQVIGWARDWPGRRDAGSVAGRTERARKRGRQKERKREPEGERE
jgi:hypothetical protein